MNVLSFFSGLWAKITSPQALKTEAKLLGIAATVSTNPAVAAELAVASKAVGVISETQTDTKPE